ncbi:hypothetical protein GCM10009682_62540 [Luedemannella flava]|uniref:Anti-sigma factor n=1 Tax=Luedemannella flava TaxID=349316 RepID=A0ABP4Z0D4_9ACTN
MPLDSQEAARLALREIHRDYGAAGLDDDDLMHRLLPDLLAGSRREANLLVAAASTDVARLLSGRIGAGMSPDAAVRDVATVLAERSGLGSAASVWVVSEYAAVLGHDPGARTAEVTVAEVEPVPDIDLDADDWTVADGDPVDAGGWPAWRRPWVRWVIGAGAAVLLLAGVGVAAYRMGACSTAETDCGGGGRGTGAALNTARAATVSIGPGEVRMSPISCATGPGAPVPTSPSDYYVDDTKISFYNATAGPVHVFHLWYDASAGQYRAFEAEIVHAGGRVVIVVGSQRYWLVRDAAGGCLAYFATVPSTHGAAVVAS